MGDPVEATLCMDVELVKTHVELMAIDVGLVTMDVGLVTMDVGLVAMDEELVEMDEVLVANDKVDLLFCVEQPKTFISSCLNLDPVIQYRTALML